MSFEFLTPVQDEVLAYVEQLPDQAIGKQVAIHSVEEGVPSLEKVSVAILGIAEGRGVFEEEDRQLDFAEIRKSFYGLYPGNWFTSMVDLGDIPQGNSISDTHYLIKEVVATLLQKNIIPLIIGGGQDLVYAQYRAYDILERMVNLVNVDSSFDIGDTSKEMTNTSYVGKIIVNEPYNLFNYSNIGYQTYFNSQEEIDLIERLYFDAYRLGEVINDITVVEPIMRDADIVVMDMGAISSSFLGGFKASPNGFDGREICAISRYAGISDKVKSFGIYEFKNFENEKMAAALVAQIFWYFIEGVNYRSNDLDVKKSGNSLHYNVPIGDDILSFYKSNKTGRWWIEIPFISSGNNKLQRHTLLPCTYDDYEKACNQEIPERWYKAKQKNEV
ncbi:formimidoylglutamase [Aquimarina sp. TRL1]|uniref:formimidoylglutamase n=1 Tax=Aquimarina sp. (strain TRL1) TaxID=2736252 RepID=UPI00158B45E5|nr:formimidoylglutamase [Aquimarina sp. TRL1]QKX04233.1 formimidoylglutamase [Aquimarina sp. TRL1]